MQHQQVGGGGGQPLGGYGGGAAAEMLISDEDQKLGDLGIAEAASPISSRPPASTTIGSNTFEEMIQATAEAGGSSGNRWPRQETLALLQIRSEMDAAFRDATLKGPLWEQVSRKLGELGYNRSGKKCKEKFENVHKYYKRTKEGRGGRQDGKSYKFFTQLEALHHSTAAAVQAPPRTTAVPLSMPPPPQLPPPVSVSVSLPPPHDHIGTGPSNIFGNVGVNFSSDSSSSSDGDDEDEDEEMEMESTGDGMKQNQRKRKRSGGSEDSDERMMDFFEGLLKQVMQKQEAMQQKFLEAIEKREHDRMIREEAWKRQDMARIAREHDLMAQERAISASRDAAIVAFLEKITGQTIHLPTTPVPQNPPPPPPTAATDPPPPSERQAHPHQGNEAMEPHDQITNTCSDMVAVMPEQQQQQQIVPHQDSTVETISSRWPKTEVLALIQLRSGKETKYQESGPKGPLWEEISADMQRMGYNRNPKRCKEKWENINKYFKKVKESNKKRPEDAKTCPYFNELDAWYRKKQHGNTSTTHANAVAAAATSAAERKHLVEDDDVGMQSLPANVVSTPFHQHRDQADDIGGQKQPEDMLKKQHQRSHGDDHLIHNCNNNVDCFNSDDLEPENDDEDNYEEVDENDEEMKMLYKIQFQRQNVRPASNGGGTTSSSFVAMVQ